MPAGQRGVVDALEQPGLLVGGVAGKEVGDVECRVGGKGVDRVRVDDVRS